MPRHHHHHHNVIFIPMGDMNNVYLAADDCYNFTSLRFDEGLYHGRISRLEVDQFLFDLRNHVDLAKNIFTIVTVCIIFMIACVLFYVYCII